VLWWNIIKVWPNQEDRSLCIPLSTSTPEDFKDFKLCASSNEIGYSATVTFGLRCLRSWSRIVKSEFFRRILGSSKLRIPTAEEHDSHKAGSKSHLNLDSLASNRRSRLFFPLMSRTLGRCIGLFNVKVTPLMGSVVGWGI
jgi:hypothetical protein